MELSKGTIPIIDTKGTVGKALTYQAGDARVLFPEMIKDGYVPLDTAEIWEQQVRAARSGDSDLIKAWDQKFITGDLLVDDLRFTHTEFIQYQGRVRQYGLGGSFKISLGPNVDILRGINPEIERPFDLLSLTSKEYDRICSEQYHRAVLGDIMGGSRTQKQYVKKDFPLGTDSLLPVLARHPQVVPERFARREGLLSDYILEVEKKGFMGPRIIANYSRLGNQTRAVCLLTVTGKTLVSLREYNIFADHIVVVKAIPSLPAEESELEDILGKIRPHIRTQDRDGHHHMLAVRKILSGLVGKEKI